MTERRGASLASAVLLTTASSLLAPVVGLVVAPLLARALSTDGRGELAVAIAPGSIMLAVATLGLPEALTFFLARDSRSARRATAVACGITTVLGVLFVLVTVAAAPALASGDADLARLIVLATIITIPALLVNVLRGSAAGRQMWAATAWERVVLGAARLISTTALFVTDTLTVTTALLVAVVSSVVSGLVYFPLLRKGPDIDHADATTYSTRGLVRFGSKIWFGGVAGMLIARTGQLLMAPLSTVEDLGIFSVAVTVADVPVIVAFAIQGALYGVMSARRDADQVTLTSRMTLLVCTAGCLAMSALSPVAIPVLFGSEYRASVLPTILLLVSAIISVPGLMAASAIGAWNRPEVRSMVLGATLVFNVLAYVALVPPLGVYGGCLASLGTNAFMTVAMVVLAARQLEVPSTAFVLVGRSDLQFLLQIIGRAGRQARQRVR